MSYCRLASVDSFCFPYLTLRTLPLRRGCRNPIDLRKMKVILRNLQHKLKDSTWISKNWLALRSGDKTLNCPSVIRGSGWVLALPPEAPWDQKLEFGWHQTLAFTVSYPSLCLCTSILCLPCTHSCVWMSSFFTCNITSTYFVFKRARMYPEWPDVCLMPFCFLIRPDLFYFFPWFA